MDEAILHLAPAERWRAWPAETPYLPEPYESGGFVHCTAGEALMLAVANRFYRDIPGDFVVLTLDPARLSSPLKWEAASDGLAPLFPHIYGPIDLAAVTAVRSVIRDRDGTFTGFASA